MPSFEPSCRARELALPWPDISLSISMRLLRGSCALSHIVVRKKLLNCRVYASFIEQVKQFVGARRTPKIIIG